MKKPKEFNIVAIGTGGQGILTLTFIMAEAALKQGYDVKTSELHGLAQRGGSVSCHIRFGKKIYSPIVRESEANLIIALEPLEALRACYYGSRENGTVIIFNTFPIVPLSVSILKESYPSLEKIENVLKEFASQVIPINATEIAKKELGKGVFANVFMLGYAFGLGLIPIEKKNLEEGIKEVVKEKYLESNLRAFELGIEKAKS